MFVNAVKFNKTYPHTRIITNIQATNLEVGNEAKLRCNGEYVWVKIETVTKLTECDIEFKGKVLNDPVFYQDFKKDDIVDFTDEHIFDVRKEYDWI